MIKKERERRIAEIKHDLLYERHNGNHTYHMCECGRQSTRRYGCVRCLQEELADLEKANDNKNQRKMPVS